MFKEKVVELLSEETKLKKKKLVALIEVPPDSKLGDYAFPCFILSKKMKKNPKEIAKEISQKLSSNLFEKIQATGPYINFFVDKKKLAEEVIDIDSKYGKGKEGKKIMVEFPSPNTNKPLHLGHLRNIVIGESVSRILEFSGNKAIRVNLNQDRGIHICKSMLAYEKYGKGTTPEQQGKKSDHFVGDFYVLYNQKVKTNKNLEKQAQECLRQWEKGDKKTIELWKKMNNWALSGFKQTFDLLGLKFDKEYYESEVYTKGKDIIEKGIEKGFFKKKGKAVIIKLGKVGKEDLGEKYLLRSDGTSVYMTQDLALAKIKNDEFKLDGSIYVVGNEQIYHFKVLFEILKKFNFKFTKNLHHLSYGMVELPEGKMKSREGTVVDADDLIGETKKLAIDEIKQRYTLPSRAYEERGIKIALSAIRYTLLKVDINKNMLFNPKEAISFEGDTGPYLQYSYARASSILKKAKKPGKPTINNLQGEEIELTKKLYSFPEVVSQARQQLNPSLVANYSLKLAQIFNEFYHKCPVIGDENEAFRLKLVESFTIVMKTSLWLLGIEALEEM